MTKRALIRTLEREREAFARERAHLIDVICHLARSPWTPAPADMEREWEPEQILEPVSVVPDQWPE